MAPAGALHGDTANNIAYILTDFVRQWNYGRVFVAETEFILRRNPDTVRALDVAFVSSGRLEGEEFPSWCFELAPDVVAEVVSPNDSAYYVQTKA